MRIGIAAIAAGLLVLSVAPGARAQGVAPVVEAAPAGPAELRVQLQALDQDPSLGDYAAIERYRAREALTALDAADDRSREHALYVARRRVEAAQVAAQAELAQAQLMQLEREHDRIVLQATRAEAERARREIEQLRLQSLAQQEEAERLRQMALEGQSALDDATLRAQAASAEAAQARRLAQARQREAELARKEAELAASLAQPVDDAPSVDEEPPPSSEP
ncbi:hypothetical protein [Coralloluteibacterium stylophorae]|uniref:DUF4398 domain-containing protein n=1 Tax=Coralloluteibacterium stylophorae TaxID=1776034 RepID=A0A8J7VXP1_9GAMM|nr:hypothetical protein [Coralloluteibacterium stylophorae]MBS7457841.1 hypothetical protein [Coralloluteibacterium stylophorae]